MEEGEIGPLRKRRTEQHLLELPEMKNNLKNEERRILRGSYRAIPRTLQDWNVGVARVCMRENVWLSYMQECG